MSKMTRKEFERQQFEEDFYERWNNYLPKAKNQELISLNEKCQDVSLAYPDTMIWLKHAVLQEMHARNI